MTGPRTTVLLALGGSVLAAGVLAALFLLGRRDTGDTIPAPPPDRAEAIAFFDSGIDTVLAGFGVAPGEVRKRAVTIPGAGFDRTERLVTLPDSVAAVSVNAALNAMARRRGGRAVASENARQGTVTIHLELDGIVVHTVIVRHATPGAARKPGSAT